MTVRLSNLFLSLARWTTLVTIVLIPITVFPFLAESHEMAKQTVLLVGVFLAALFWFATDHVRDEQTRGVPEIGLLSSFVVLLALSAWFSIAPYASWVGSGGQQVHSVLTWFGLLLLFFLLLQPSISRWMHERIAWVFAGLGALLGAGFILQTIGFVIEHQTLSGLSFVGTVNALALMLIVLFLGAYQASFREKRSVPFSIVLGFVGVSATCAVLVADYNVLYWLFAIGLLLMIILPHIASDSKTSKSGFWVPLSILSLLVVFIVVGGAWFPIHAPVQVTPSMDSTMKIAESVREGALVHDATPNQLRFWLGSGPGTFDLVYAQLRPPEIAETAFWDMRFRHGFSFFSTLFATVGPVLTGLLVLTLLVTGILAIVRKQYRYLPVWAVLFVAAFTVPFNLTLLTWLIVMSALILSYPDATTRTAHSMFIRFMRTGLIILLSFALLIGLFGTGFRLIADAAYANALRMDRRGSSTSDIIRQLDRAATRNRFHDGYQRALAQSLVTRVQEVSNQLKDDSMNTSSKVYLQGLVGSSVNAAVRSTEYSPHNSLNWLARGNVYRQYMQLVDGADVFARDAHERAVELEPNHPLIRKELGATYQALARRQQRLIAATDEKASEDARVATGELFDEAIRSYNNAIELRATYAPAHFGIAQVHVSRGELDAAIGKLESVYQYNRKDVGVLYQLGILYLDREAEGDLVRAQTVLETVLEAAPSFANARWFLASVHEKQGNIPAALEQLEQIQRLDPNNEVVRQRIRRLQEGEVSDESPEPLDAQVEAPDVSVQEDVLPQP